MYTVYWLISENMRKTYVGFTSNLEERLKRHKNREVETTKDFGNFIYCVLEKVDNVFEARKKEKYWKSCAGRKKLKKIFPAPSSSG